VKYTLLFWTDDSIERTEEEGQAIHRDVVAWVDEMTGRGVLLEDHRLSPATDTTTVSVRDGEVLLGDGPFAETKEQIAGYVVIEVADLDEAIEVAAADPLARIGTVEVRPLWEQ
jgi:hypothetical protein